MSSPEIQCGDLLLKLDLGEPSQYAKEKAARELRETPENVENSLKTLRDLLKEELNLHVPINDDAWLLKFLRVCKFYPESTLDLIKRFYALRLKNQTNITDKLIPSKLKHVFDSNVVSIAPHRDQCGRRIIYSMSGKIWNNHVIDKYDVFSGSVVCSDAIQLEPETQINGVVYIIDMEGCTLSKILQFTPSFIKLNLDYLQGNVPLRIQGFHIVNQPDIFNPVFSFAKKFMASKFAKRILTHGTNYESLHQYVLPEYLPERYGGTMKTDLSYCHETYELLSHYEKQFEVHQKYGYKPK